MVWKLECYKLLLGSNADHYGLAIPKNNLVDESAIDAARCHCTDNIHGATLQTCPSGFSPEFPAAEDVST